MSAPSCRGSRWARPVELPSSRSHFRASRRSRYGRSRPYPKNRPRSSESKNPHRHNRLWRTRGRQWFRVDKGFFPCGCSPDGLIGDDGGIEIKCPTGGVHVKTLLGQKVPTEHLPQIQGSMLVTGRSWWDFMSYHTEMPPLIVRVHRDSTYTVKLMQAIKEFNNTMVTRRGELKELGYYGA